MTLQNTERCRGTLSLWQGTHWILVPCSAHLDHSRGLKLLARGQLALAQTWVGLGRDGMNQPIVTSAVSFKMSTRGLDLMGEANGAVVPRQQEATATYSSIY